MDFVTALTPLLGLAFLIERIMETVFNVLEKYPPVSNMKTPPDLARVKSETSAAHEAAVTASRAAAEAAAAKPGDAAAMSAADAAAKTVAEAKVKADKASADAAAAAASYGSTKQIMTMIASIVVGIILANQLQIPLIAITASDVVLPSFVNNYSFAGAVAGVTSPFAHQVLEAVLNFQKLLEEQKKKIAGDVRVTE